MTAPVGFDPSDLVAVRAVWFDEATGGLRALRAEMGATMEAGQRASPAMQSFGRAIAEMGGAAPTATAGTRRLQNAMISLGIVTAGLPSQLGRVASSFLLLSTGGTATIALLGGAALVSQALQSIGKEARDARDAHEKLLESLQKRVEQAHPQPALQREQVAGAVEIVGHLEAIERIRGTTLSELSLQGEELIRHQQEEQDQINAHQRRINELVEGIQRSKAEELGLTQKMAEIEIAPSLAQLAALLTAGQRDLVGRLGRGGVFGLTIPGAEVPPGPAPFTGRGLFNPFGGPGLVESGVVQGAAAGVGAFSPARQALKEVREEAGRSALSLDDVRVALEGEGVSGEELDAVLKKLKGSMDEAGVSADRLGLALLSAVSTALESAIAGRGGSALGFFGGIAKVGGALAGFSPLGIGLTLGGAVLSGLASREHSTQPIPVHDDRTAAEIRAMRQQVVEKLISLQLGSLSWSGQDLGNVVYWLNRATSLDAIPRIPTR